MPQGDVDQRNRRARVAVATTFFVQGVCFAALLTQTAALQRRFKLSDAELSLVLLAVPVLAGVGSVLAGAMATRKGSAAVLRAGNLLVCAAIVAVAASGAFAALAGALVAVGLGLGLVDASMNMQGVAVERRYGRPVLASMHAVWSAGAIAGALASFAGDALDLSMLTTLGAVGAIGAALALAAGPSLLHGVESGATPQQHAGSLPWKPIVLVGIAMTLVFIADSAASNWSTVYLDRLAGDGATSALGLAAYQGATLLGRTFADRFSAAVGASRTVAIGSLVGAAGLAVVASASGPFVAILGFGVLGLGVCVVVPQSFSAAGRLDPAGTGIAVARVNLFNYVGFVLGAALIGVVAEASSLRLAFAVPALLCLGITALAPAFGARSPRARLGEQPRRDAGVG